MDIKKIIVFSIFIILFFISSLNYAMNNSIKNIGEMNSPRAFHKSEKLNDGTVLISGGYKKMAVYSSRTNGPNYYHDYISEESAEIYNPQDNSFKKTSLKPDKNDNITISEKEKTQIREHFKNNNVDFGKMAYIGDILYFKIDKQRILCVPYYNKHPIAYGPHPVSQKMLVYNTQTKKINEIVSLGKKAEYINAVPYNVNNTTKMLIIYDLEIVPENMHIIDTSKIQKFFQIVVFNPDTNTIEHTLNPFPIKLFYKHKLIPLENGNIIVEEDNVLKYMFDKEEQKIKPLKNNGFKLNKGANIIPLNNNSLLITGGYIEKTLENDKKIQIQNNVFFCNTERKILKTAYIYNF